MSPMIRVQKYWVCAVAPTSRQYTRKHLFIAEDTIKHQRMARIILAKTLASCIKGHQKGRQHTSTPFVTVDATLRTSAKTREHLHRASRKTKKADNTQAHHLSLWTQRCGPVPTRENTCIVHQGTQKRQTTHKHTICHCGRNTADQCQNARTKSGTCRISCKGVGDPTLICLGGGGSVGPCTYVEDQPRPARCAL
jgi:hypothetical protein